MAVAIILMGGVTGMMSFLIGLLIGMPLGTAFMLYFAVAFTTIFAVVAWRLLNRPKQSGHATPAFAEAIEFGIAPVKNLAECQVLNLNQQTGVTPLRYTDMGV